MGFGGPVPNKPLTTLHLGHKYLQSSRAPDVIDLCRSRAHLLTTPKGVSMDRFRQRSGGLKTPFFVNRAFERVAPTVCLFAVSRGLRSKALIFQKNPHVRNFSARNSGARNGRANLMGAWDFLVLSAGKIPMPMKFLLLEGGSGHFRRGVEVPILFFTGVGIFPNFVG